MCDCDGGWLEWGTEPCFRCEEGRTLGQLLSDAGSDFDDRDREER